MAKFVVLLLAYTISQFFRSFLAVIAPELSRELGLTPADLGNMSALWFCAFALAQLYVGWSLDRLGPRRTMSLMMLAAVAGAVLLASAHGLAGCLIGMALIGFGCAPLYMGSLFLFAREAGGTERFALLSSLLLAIGSLGNAVSSTPLAAAAQAFGWRPTFLGIAAATALSAGLIAIVIRDPERIEPPSGGKGLLAGITSILSLKVLWPMLPITFVSYAVILAERGLWVGPFLAEVHGLSPVPRGNAVLAMALSMSVGALAYGATDRVRLGRKAVVFAGSLVTALSFIALGVFGSTSLLLSIAALALIGAAGMTYVQLMAHARTFIPEALLGRGISTMNMLYFAGAAVVQQISGAVVAGLKQANWPPAEAFSALHESFGVLLLAATLIYVFTRTR